MQNWHRSGGSYRKVKQASFSRDNNWWSSVYQEILGIVYTIESTLLPYSDFILTREENIITMFYQMHTWSNSYRAVFPNISRFETVDIFTGCTTSDVKQITTAYIRTIFWDMQILRMSQIQDYQEYILEDYQAFKKFADFMSKYVVHMISPCINYFYQELYIWRQALLSLVWCIKMPPEYITIHYWTIQNELKTVVKWQVWWPLSTLPW